MRPVFCITPLQAQRLGVSNRNESGRVPVDHWNKIAPDMVRNLGLIFAAALTAECFGVSTHLDGVWRSQGWGLICQVRNSDWQTYAVTRTTCVAASTAKRLTKPDPENEPTLRGRDGSLFSIVRAGDSDHKRITTPTGLTNIVIERIAALPKVCTPPTANTPLNNFDVFAQTFAEQYISFDLRHLDWVQAIAEQRGKVAAQTTPTELFDMLSGMIKPLADIHTGIEASKLRREFDAPLRPGSDRVVHGNIERSRRTAEGRWRR